MTVVFSAAQVSSGSSTDGDRRRYGDSRRSGWREVHRCKVICAIVALVVFVVVAIALGVYFAGEFFHRTELTLFHTAGECFIQV